MLEEAGYISPTWADLRTLQQIDSATRIDGEGAMSVCSFLQSAGRRDLLFLGKQERQTVLNSRWEGLSEQEKASWLEEASKTHYWVMLCRSQQEADEASSRMHDTSPSLR